MELSKSKLKHIYFPFCYDKMQMKKIQSELISANEQIIGPWNQDDGVSFRDDWIQDSNALTSLSSFPLGFSSIVTSFSPTVYSHSPIAP